MGQTGVQGHFLIWKNKSKQPNTKVCITGWGFVLKLVKMARFQEREEIITNEHFLKEHQMGQTQPSKWSYLMPVMDIIHASWRATMCTLT